MEEIGYAIDFKEIKRVGCQWIDDLLDHGVIVNPHDESVIKCAQETGSKIWFMSLNGSTAYCNPSVENIAKEVFLAMELLFINYSGLKISKVKIHETPNCSTKCTTKSISQIERTFWQQKNKASILKYAEEKGMMNYDDRK